MTELSRRQMLRMSPQARGAMLERQAGELGDYYGKERMSETTTTYDTGEVRVSVGGNARDMLESAWCELAGKGMWGELVCTFRGGRLHMAKVSHTIRFDWEGGR